MRMTNKIIKGLKEIYHKYDVFFIDLWGVIHNGIQLYPGAIEVLEELFKLKKRFVLMSNAPRPSKNVEKFLLNLKMDKILLGSSDIRKNLSLGKTGEGLSVNEI